MATYEIDTMTRIEILGVGSYMRPCGYAQPAFGVSFAEMGEFEQIVGDARDRSGSFIEFGRADSPIIRAVNPPDVDALAAYVQARGWTMTEVR